MRWNSRYSRAAALLFVIAALFASCADASMKGPDDRAGSAPHIRHTPGESSYLADILDGMVVLYQQTFSTLEWSNCQFYPSCSNYARHAIAEHGAPVGGLMSADRLIRCNRWAWESGQYPLRDDGQLLDPVARAKVSGSGVER